MSNIPEEVVSKIVRGNSHPSAAIHLILVSINSSNQASWLRNVVEGYENGVLVMLMNLIFMIVMMMMS